MLHLAMNQHQIEQLATLLATILLLAPISSFTLLLRSPLGGPKYRSWGVAYITFVNEIVCNAS